MLGVLALGDTAFFPAFHASLCICWRAPFAKGTHGCMWLGI